MAGRIEARALRPSGSPHPGLRASNEGRFPSNGLVVAENERITWQGWFGVWYVNVMSDLLLEIGVEELPVSFVKMGLASLEEAATAAFATARLKPESLEVFGTPRRLALHVRGIPLAQESRHEVVSGPPWSAAFREGAPTKAAEGFARKHGVAVEDLKKLSTDKGDYVSVEVSEEGRPAADILEAALPSLCQGVRFPKVMRWGEGEHAFGRPVHWIVALLDERVLPFEFAGATADRKTRGHRFLAPAEFELKSADEYEARLAEAHVVARTAKREDDMRAALNKAASEIGGVLVPDEFLIRECATLVEEPFVVPGTFDDVFLQLPEEVVVSVMRDHQRYFAVRGADGKLLPRYLNVVNTALSPASIAEGNDRVLRARLADARFFVDEDRKSPLESRLTKLDSVVFHRKLGTVGAKVQRIVGLAKAFAEDAGVQAHAEVAARLAKADLETLIVFEFPDLQGKMGAYYARKEGLPEEVCQAIADHYRPVGADDEVAPGALGALIGSADRVDTLVGCFGVGLIPKGNKDPFALRRAAHSLMRTAFEGPIDIDLAALFSAAYDQYAEGLGPKAKVMAGLDEFLRARLRALYKERYRSDVIEAGMAAWDGGSLRDLDARLKAVESLRGTDAFEALATAFKRAYNITKGQPRGDVDPSLLEAGAETTLNQVYEKVRAELRTAVSERRYEDALRLVATDLRGPIDTYFEEVFVMVDDEAVRANRLRFLGNIADEVNGTAHFHLLGGDA